MSLVIWGKRFLQAGRLSSQLEKEVRTLAEGQGSKAVREPFALTKFSPNPNTKKWTAWHKVNKFLASID